MDMVTLDTVLAAGPGIYSEKQALHLESQNCPAPTGALVAGSQAADGGPSGEGEPHSGAPQLTASYFDSSEFGAAQARQRDKVW